MSTTTSRYSKEATLVEAICGDWQWAKAVSGGVINRTRFFELIKNGEVDARKVGRRTAVMAASLCAYLQSLPKAD